MAALGISLLLALALFSEYGETKQLKVYAATKMNWFKAMEYCQSKSIKLVSIMNKQEHEQLQTAIWSCSKTCGEHIEHSWTSGADPDHDGKFIWATGQEIAADRWAVDHPPDNWEGNEHCVEAFDIPREKQVVLNDRPCDDEMQYVVCEA